MENKLISICLEKINDYDEEISKINKVINRIRPIYDKICPKGRKFNEDDNEQILNICQNDNLVDNICDILSDNCPFLLTIMMKNKKKYDEYSDFTNKELLKRGLTKGMVYSDAFLSSIKRSSLKDPSKKAIYDKIIEMKEKDLKLFELNREIIVYSINYVLDKYNNCLNAKEDLKNNQKMIKYASSKIKHKEKLNSNDIIALNEIIINSANSDDLSRILNNYNEQFKKETNEKEIIQIKKYVDDVTIKEDDFDEEESYIPDVLFENYVISINNIKIYDDLKTFLDSLCYKYNIKEFLSNALLYVSDDVKENINKYLKELEKEDEIADDDSKENVILFNGFLNNKNIIKDDLKRHNIPDTYYQDVKKGIFMILENGALGKRENIKKVPKVLKLRVNDIRIAFKRLKSNVYIILGIYVKKDSVGNKIIESIRKRNNELLSNEKIIINAFDKDSLTKEIVDLNNLYYNELNNLLGSKAKMKL